MLVVITYAFPAGFVIEGLTAHSLGLVEVSLLTSCQLVVITYVFPADGGSRGLAAYSLSLVVVSVITSSQLSAHGAGGNYL